MSLASTPALCRNGFESDTSYKSEAFRAEDTDTRLTFSCLGKPKQEFFNERGTSGGGNTRCPWFVCS